jgi:hypothetical protein
MTCRADGYLLRQPDIKDPLSRDPQHWPRNAFVSSLALALDVDDSGAGTLDEQISCFGQVDWATVYYATEMYFFGTPVEMLKQAFAQSEPVRVIKALFNAEFGLWDTFRDAKRLQRMTDMTVPAFADHVRQFYKGNIVVFSRDDDSIARQRIDALDSVLDNNEVDASGGKSQKRVKRGSSSQPAKKARK